LNERLGWIAVSFSSDVKRKTYIQQYFRWG
jgi:hypothetical protein